MPDKWEYPWFAAWDLAFHAVTLAHVDPGFAKSQLLVLCRESFQQPNGALPAYEWSFDDVNPPVHALQCACGKSTGNAIPRFSLQVFHKLMIDFTWWLNRQDSAGRNLFSGGFLGLDNLSAFDRMRTCRWPGASSSPTRTGMDGHVLHGKLLRIAVTLSEREIRPTARSL